MKINFLPIMKQRTIQEDTRLMDVMLALDIDGGFACGGHQTCGKCKVLITKGNRRDFTDAEMKLLTEKERQKGYRLACCFVVKEDTCVVLDKVSEKNNKETCQSVIFREMDTIGIVFDIGTTTVEACVVVNQDSVYALPSRVNPQKKYGLDVISRISYGIKSSENQKKLHNLIIQCINSMINDCQEIYQIKKEQITDIVILGNTTMIYLLMELELEQLSKGNFCSQFNGSCLLAKDLELHACPKARVFIPRLLGGHVGSDILGCILGVRLWEKKETGIIVDIGTNGEIAMVKDGMISVCSTAAGPAFEGARIVNGMRAKEGAIFSVKEENGVLEVSTIGNVIPCGICGSGLIDAAAVFLKIGKMDETGKLIKPYVSVDKTGKVMLWQQDIRELQLAKAAIVTGIRMLADYMEIQSNEIQTFMVAGAFGNGICIDNAIAIGLFPDIKQQRFHCIGNGAILGGIALLKGTVSFEDANCLAKSIKHVELAALEGFNECYIKSLNF